MKLVVVESPAKSKTINKYLGKDYKVVASFGHIRDLPSKNGAVKPEEDFSFEWNVEKTSEKKVRDIITNLNGADTLILATDPDREGEAIAWHICEELRRRKKLKDIKIERVVFNEITKKAVTDAIKAPRELNIELIDAYLARRALDYLVGFTLSPVLWRKLPGSKSAGRVQSVALRLICERETEIDKFDPQEYWSIDVDLLTTENKTIKSKLTHLNGKKLDKFDINNKEKADNAVQIIKTSDFVIDKIDRKKANRNPAPPFTTSTLQQEASRKLRFSAKKTMQIAQKLYEGVDDNGGLITYMRTDAVNLAAEAITAARDLISKDFGDNYNPKTPRVYKTKSKNAQEAHEAIRPTNLFRKPTDIKHILDADQYRLYELIWKRTIASQMASAILDKVAIDSISTDKKTTLRATGQVIAFDGFLKLYKEDKDEDNEEDDAEKLLPNVNEGENVNKGEITPEQHFTQPPYRYTEASLVKKLEELGIGRPSTYASILSVLQDRQYVRLITRKFYPENRGRIVTAFLENYFKQYVEYDFTAQMEEKLDDISNGNMNWKELLNVFWDKFKKHIDATDKLSVTEILDKIDETLEHLLVMNAEDKENPRKCPKCGGRLNIKIGKFGGFIGCEKYPDCDYTKQINITDKDENTEDGATTPIEIENIKLGEDKESGKEVWLKKGPYGFYIQLGETEKGSKQKPKRASIPKGVDHLKVSLSDALNLLSLPKNLGKNPKTKEDLILGVGRFGPYIKQGANYHSVPATDNILTIDINKAIEIVENDKKKIKSPAKEIGEHPDTKEKITLNSGRYGPYLKHGKQNIAIPKNLQGQELSLEQAVEIIKNKESKK